jgi:DNA primase
MVMEEIDYTAVIDVLEDVLGEHRAHNEYRGQISFDCPTCSYDIKGLDMGDGKGNLEVNYKQSVFKCWVCSETHETHGSIFRLIKKFGTARQLKKYQLLRPDDDIELPKRKYKQIRLPKEFIAFKDVTLGQKLTPQYKQAYNYIKSRNISDDMLIKYNIGYCTGGLYENRIILPSYDEENELNYFVARSYLTKTKRKYLNPEVDKEKIIWNQQLIDWNKPVYIVEGAFDSIFLPNSIPLLGKFMTKKLFDMLYDNAKYVIIVLDGDAWEDAVKLYHKINVGKLLGKIWVVKLPIDKDIADLEGKINKKDIKQLD